MLSPVEALQQQTIGLHDAVDTLVIRTAFAAAASSPAQDAPGTAIAVTNPLVDNFSNFLQQVVLRQRFTAALAILRLRHER